jgi:cyclophilin family peptidyl-prolyl cis-trans isomerase
MVAPTRVPRNYAAPLMRSQRSGSRIVLKFAMLGVVGSIVAAFLVHSLRQQSNPSSITSAATQQQQQQVKTANSALKKTQDNKEETLVLSTLHGNIRMVMRPDLSAESVEYIRELVHKGTCDVCNFYRAEKDFLLQGVMKNEKSQVKVTKGQCPPGYEAKTDDCPPDQFACGCHGPTMERGLVGFAAGDTGPDFFITTCKGPVTDWGQTHTVFGEVKDEASFAVIDKIYALPSTRKGLTILDEKIDFTPSLE